MCCLSVLLNERLNGGSKAFAEVSLRTKSSLTLGGLDAELVAAVGVIELYLSGFSKRKSLG